jgi:DNA-binding response OmpR family regulator
MNLPIILVVDDDPAIRKFVQINLEARGYSALTASNGEEAVIIAKAEKPDLVILDIMMPGMDGFSACRLIREWSTMPIIMLSAREGISDSEISKACGANDYFTKPFALKELLSKVKTYLQEK